MPTVFRWNITRREQLGRLVDGGPAEINPWLLQELRLCCARVIAMAGNARLAFVGRSPEDLYDYLTGAFEGTSWAGRLTLINLSLKGDRSDWMASDSDAYAALREQFTALGLAPIAIATSPYPVALIDLIFGGETFGKFTAFLMRWSADERVGWRAVRRRLRIVGITERQNNGLRSWRWRRLDWAQRYPPSSLKGVAVPPWFWSHLGDSVKKVSRSNPPARWRDPEMARPPRGDDVQEALRAAVALYDLGRSRQERDSLAAALAIQPAVRHAWCRTLAAELRAVSRPKRIERAFGSKHRVRSWRRHVRASLPGGR